MTFDQAAAVLLFALALLSMSGSLLATHTETKAAFSVIAMIALLGIVIIAII